MKHRVRTTIALALTSSVASAQMTEPDAVDPTAIPASSSLIPAIDFEDILEGVKAEFYGQLRMDVSASTDEVDNGDIARAVLPEGQGGDQFGVTSRTSRLGVRFSGPGTANIKTSGLIEADFFRGNEINSAFFRTRHAYVNFDFVEEDFSILIGQTADVISPLLPSRINLTPNWWQGDMGFRRHQVRFTKGYDLGGDSKLRLTLAATRVIGAEDRLRPGIQARVGYTFPGPTGKTTVGISGHDAREAGNAESNSLNLDLKMPINEKLSFKGEIINGENLDQYVGFLDRTGNTQGAGVQTTGFWGAVNIKSSPKWTYNVGFGYQSSDEDDLTPGDIEANSVIFGNAIYTVDAATSVGLELSRLDTDYVDQRDEDAFRLQLGIRFNF